MSGVSPHGAASPLPWLAEGDHHPLCSHLPRRHLEIVVCFSLKPREQCHGQSSDCGRAQIEAGCLHPSKGASETPAASEGQQRRRGKANPVCAVVVLVWGVLGSPSTPSSSGTAKGRALPCIRCCAWGFFDPSVLSRREEARFGCGVMSSCSVTAVGREGRESEGELIPKPAQLVRFSAAWCESSLPPPPGTRAAVTAADGAEAVFPVFLARFPHRPTLKAIPPAPLHCSVRAPGGPGPAGCNAPDKVRSLGHHPSS